MGKYKYYNNKNFRKRIKSRGGLIMNIADLIKQNNKLRSQLNEDNKKYYEELLVACRMKNTTKKESELEIELLEILQDLILYQKQGKSFTDVFGNDINKLSSSILVELPKENKVKIFRFSLVYLLILIISSLVPSVFTRTIQPIILRLCILRWHSTMRKSATTYYQILISKSSETVRSMKFLFLSFLKCSEA